MAVALALATSPAPAQTGTLVGRVTDAATGLPVVGAEVAVAGTPLAARADATGRFRLAGVPTGPRSLRARALGYAPAAAPFALAPGATDTVHLSLSLASAVLDAIAVTGTLGDMRRRAVGHSVMVVNAAEAVGRSAVANLAEVVQAKAPGLTLMPGSGTVGTAANYRLRGAGSIHASTSPPIYVDGVRVSARTQGNYETFSQSTTALDAINPADIESVEIIKGPAAATLYGAEAAAGVIQVFTKRGRPGRIDWRSRVEIGRSDWDERLRPVNYAIATPGRLDSAAAWPGFVGKSVGEVISVRPLTDGRALRIAGLSKLVLSAGGGGDRYTFFLSAARSDEEGVQRNNFSNLRSIRGNVTLVPTNALTVTTNVALGRTHVRLPLNGRTPHSLVSSAYLAVPGKAYPYAGGPDYAVITPELANAYDNQTRADRYTLGASADYAPIAWLRSTLRVGLDANVGRAELYFAPDPRSPFLPRFSLDRPNAKGLIAQGRPLSQDVTLSWDATATRRLSGALVSNTSAGVQYLASSFQRTDAIGTDLGSAGLRSVAAAAVTSSTESFSEQKAVGVYAQQQLSLDDRLFVTLAARADDNSAFGARLDRVLYPKASVSYVISEAPFFAVPGVGSLRLRAAWGQAGNAPGPLDAARTYTASVVTDSGGTSSALRYGSPGNPHLRPERGSEIEVGFESALLGDRVRLDVSWYDKTTRDALMPVEVAPSTGFTGSRLVNLGEISNTGMEMQLAVFPVRRKALTVDAALTLATNRNRLVSFGDARAPIDLSGTGDVTFQRHQEGYPLAGMWGERVRLDADGALLKVDGRPQLDSASVYVGPSVPTREMSLTGGVVLFGRLRVHALADYKAGHYQFNLKDWRRDQAGVSWETVNPAADRDEVLARQFVFQSFLHIQRADFVKLRDLSIGLDLPEGLLRGVARHATLVLAGHNLKVWTKYGGADPEVSIDGPGGVTTFYRADYWAVPQTRRYSAAVAVAF